MKRNITTIEYDAQQTMLIMIVALAPCFMMGVYVFGLDMLDNMLGACGAAVLLTWITGMITGAGKRAAGSRSGSPEGASGMSGTSGGPDAARLAPRQDMEPEYLAAIVTGSLIVFGLPSTIPVWMVMIGAAAAVIPGGIIVRFMQKLTIGSSEKDYSGYDRNETGGAAASTQNSAGSGVRRGADAMLILERAVITAVVAQTAIWAIFRTEATTWPLNDFVETRVSPGDVATGMTPLGILADGGDLPGLSRMFIGFISGPCGEVSVAAALIGGGYLVWKKLIPALTPVLVLASVFVTAFIYYSAMVPADQVSAMTGSDMSGLSAALYLAVYHVLAGGAAFGAFFMAPFAAAVQSGVGQAQGRTDSIKTFLQVFFALLIGFVTVVLRIKGIMTEGIAVPVLTAYVAAVCTELVMNRQKTDSRKQINRQRKDSLKQENWQKKDDRNQKIDGDK